MPGDKILLWVTGTDPIYTRGFWGTGKVTERSGPARSKSKRNDPTFRKGEKARMAADLHTFHTFCDIAMDLPYGMVSDRQLRTAGVDDLDVQLQPQGDNLSWVSKDQMNCITHAWMALIDDLSDDERVQERALRTVTAWYEAIGWGVSDLTDDELGYDLYCTSDDQDAMVLVKGVHNASAIVLYDHELEVARANPDRWHLALVRDALTDPYIDKKRAADAIAEATPYAYVLTL